MTTRYKSDRSMRITAWSLLIATYLLLAGVVALAVWMIVTVISDSNEAALERLRDDIVWTAGRPLPPVNLNLH